MVKIIDSEDNLYAQNSTYKVLSTKLITLNGMEVRKITYYDQTPVMRKIAKLFAAFLMVLGTVGIALCFTEGRKFAADALGQFRRHVVYENIAPPQAEDDVEEPSEDPTLDDLPKGILSQVAGLLEDGDLMNLTRAGKKGFDETKQIRASRKACLRALELMTDSKMKIEGSYMDSDDEYRTYWIDCENGSLAYQTVNTPLSPAELKSRFEELKKLIPLIRKEDINKGYTLREGMMGAGGSLLTFAFNEMSDRTYRCEIIKLLLERGLDVLEPGSNPPAIRQDILKLVAGDAPLEKVLNDHVG